MNGETVTVEQRIATGTDRGGDTIYTWLTPEPVENVLVASGPRADKIESNRPDGKIIRWTLHFPKTYRQSLAGARISVRNQDPLNVVGDPQPLTEENTPGEWSRPVELEGTEG